MSASARCDHFKAIVSGAVGRQTYRTWQIVLLCPLFVPSVLVAEVISCISTLLLVICPSFTHFQRHASTPDPVPLCCHYIHVIIQAIRFIFFPLCSHPVIFCKTLCCLCYCNFHSALVCVRVCHIVRALYAMPQTSKPCCWHM